MGQMIRLDSEGDGESREERRARLRGGGGGTGRTEIVEATFGTPAISEEPGPVRAGGGREAPQARPQAEPAPAEPRRGATSRPRSPRFQALARYQEIGEAIEAIDDQILDLESQRAGLVEELRPVVETIGDDPLHLLDSEPGGDGGPDAG